MNASRAAVIVVGVNLIAVWAAASAGRRVRAPERAVHPQVAADQAIEIAQASLLAAAERLGEHAGREITAAVIRDPFRFGTDARPLAQRGPAASQPERPPEAPAVAEPGEPDVVLLGMAESREGEALVRTAILRGGNDLVLATLGTQVGVRFRVVAIGADSVALEDIVSHERRTYWLK